MAKRDKRLEKIKGNRKNVSLEDFEALVRSHGAIEEGGKHPKALIGKATIPYKRISPVKPYVVDALLSAIASL